ncbi:MAG: DUF6785 family protein [Armatimonadota bacterium]
MAVLLGLAALVPCAIWVRRAEIVVLACQITESVPAVPAVATLLALVGVSALVRRAGLRGLSRAEIVVAYSFVAVAISMMGCGIGRFFFSNVLSMFYYATPANRFETAHQYIPWWFCPRNPETIRAFFEGARDGRTPWGEWLVPLTLWGVLFTSLWLTLLCLTLIFRRQWADSERLTFPLIHLPLRVTESAAERTGAPPFFRDPVMWLGFGAAAAYNLVNIAHAFLPYFPTFGKFIDIGQAFKARPWDALSPLVFWIRPEMVGFGYLVSLEVSLSAWLSFVLVRLVKVVGLMAGHEAPGFPYEQEQSVGAYLAFAAALIWGARRHLREVLVLAAKRASAGEDDPAPYVLAVAGAVVGFAGVVLWCCAAGMSAWVAVLYFGVVVVVALVYSRIRAEIGVPLIWMFPFYQQKRVLINMLGSNTFMSGGSFANLVLLSSLVLFSRGYFPALMGYQLETFQLGSAARARQRHLVWILLAAVPVGFAISAAAHLTAYYRYGAAQIGLWGTWIAVPEADELVGMMSFPRGPQVPQATATATGAVVALALTYLRRMFAWFPLHPLGYAMATAYGDLIWGPFLTVWLVKLMVLRYGGMRLYRRLIPGFLGLALGHFFVAGVLWGSIGMSYPDALRAYQVWFG